jgi:predicted negative regulator of RcsB-dependent stress response
MMSQATQTQSLEETLNRTDLGHAMYEYRIPLFGAVLAILVGITGYFVWRQSTETAALESSQQVFEFQTKIWPEAKQEKMTPEALVQSFEALDKKVQTSPLMAPLAMEMSRFLVEKGHLSHANTILSRVGSETKHHITKFFISFQQAVVLERMGNLDEAIAVMDRLAKTRDVLMPAKVSLELGRLHQRKGNVNEARTLFDHVINTYPNEEQAKLARLYLTQLNQ